MISEPLWITPKVHQKGNTHLGVCQDTFASLKKTCRKHGISFWKYLIDRTSKENKIPPLAEIIQKAACGL